MAIISAKSLLEAGVHFGHKASRWNPKMARYIFGKRNLIHIINLRETIRGLIRAYHFLSKLAAEGHDVLFVGTKRQAKNVVKQATLGCGMHYVTERWLGGTLTNYETIRRRLSRLEQLENIIESGEIEKLSKKTASALRREHRKITRNLEGIRNMTKLPGAIVIIDPNKEKNALREAAKLSIPTICLIDTDSDPDLVDIAIPGNDDAMRSIEIICNKLAEGVNEGQKKWKTHQGIESKKVEVPQSESKEKSDIQDTLKKSGEHGDEKPEIDKSVKPEKTPGKTDKPAKPEDGFKKKDFRRRKDNRRRDRKPERPEKVEERILERRKDRRKERKGLEEIEGKKEPVGEKFVAESKDGVQEKSQGEIKPEVNEGQAIKNINDMQPKEEIKREEEKTQKEAEVKENPSAKDEKKDKKDENQGVSSETQQV